MPWRAWWTPVTVVSQWRGDVTAPTGRRTASAPRWWPVEVRTWATRRTVLSRVACHRRGGEGTNSAGPVPASAQTVLRGCGPGDDSPTVAAPAACLARDISDRRAGEIRIAPMETTYRVRTWAHVYPPVTWGTVIRFDWPAPRPVWQTSGVARSSADAARLPPGGPEASPTVLVVPAQGRTYGNLPGSVSGVQARHPVGLSPPVRGSGRARTPRQGSPEEGHPCQRGCDTPDRVGRRGSGMDKDHRVQSVTRDRTTE